MENEYGQQTVSRSRLRKAIEAGKKRAANEERRKMIQMGYCSWCLRNGVAGELPGDSDPDVQELMDAVKSFTERHRMMQFAYQRYISELLEEDADEAREYVDEVIEDLIEGQKLSSL